MNIAERLPDPLDKFVLDVPQHTYYDFELPSDSTYPLAGVTYPVDYGTIPGYTSEDSKELDLFVGSTADGLMGSIIVFRGKDAPDEHKFYICVTQDELDRICAELKPVLRNVTPINSLDELLHTIETFKNKVQ